MPKKKLIADPTKNTGGRRNTGNKALDVYRGELGEGSSALDHPMHRFFERIDQSQLEDALALATEKRWTEFLRVMHDPRTYGWSMTRIAKRCGLTLADLMKFWRDSRMQQAMIITSNALPTIMSDVVHDASNRDISCPRCDGFGTLLNPRHGDPAYLDDADDGPRAPAYAGSTSLNSKQLRLCPECSGKGTVTSSGNADARKILLEAGGIIGKKAPVIMNQHNHFPGSVENFVDQVEKWDDEDRVDAEDIIEAETEDVS